MRIVKSYTMGFKKYATFEGRTQKKAYWDFMFCNITIVLFLTFVDMKMNTYSKDLEVGLIQVVYFAAIIVPSISATWRRMQDTGNKGWFMLIPIYGFLLALTEGQEGDNKYGPDPKKTIFSIEDHLID